MNDNSIIIDGLKRCDLFWDIPHEKLVQVASRVSIVNFCKDDIVFREGEIGHTFYIILIGGFLAYKETGRGVRELKRFIPGEVFGEMALISEDRRSATLRAITDSACIEITQSVFSSLLDESNSFSRKIMHILSSRLKRADDKSTQDILNAHQALIFSLSYLSESRDPTIGDHIYRVREYCALLASYLPQTSEYRNRCTPVFIENIYTVSPLHDIGKISIPDSILLKTSRLTPEEFEIIKTHPAAGAKSIAIVFEFCEIETFRIAYNVVLYHHEWFNGKGYPCGLSGEEIPLEARILAVADVYDALLSKRIYKQSFTHDDTIREMQSLAGIQFDPIILGVMMKNIDHFQEINSKYKRAGDEF